MPSNRTTRIALVLALVVSVAACGGGDDDGPTASPAPTTTEGEEVTIELVAFSPDELDVAAGATVQWTNEDPGDHTVTSGTSEATATGATTSPDGRFDSGQIAGGGTFQHVFDEPGTYEYFCELHPATMRGVVRVS